MNVLFVHEVDWLNKVVFDIHSLSEALSLLGHQVYAIDYENLWTKDSPFDFGSLKTKEIDNASRANPDAVVRLRRPGFIKLPGLSRLSAALTHYREIQKTIKERGIDVVVLYSVPTNGLQTVYLCRKLGVPVVFRAIDILNQLVRYPLLRPLTRTLERRVYASVDLVLTITPMLSRYVISLGAPESRVKQLLLGVDTNLFQPALNSTEVRQQWGFSQNDQVIVFIGTLFDFSGLDTFIPQFARVIKESPKARLLIVGDGPQRPRLDRIITELGLKKEVIITGFQPYQTMPQYINLATVCINTFLITGATRDIFPGKIVQYLACGKAVIATSLPGMRVVIHGEEQGIIYVNHPSEVAAEIISLLKATEHRQQLEQAGLNYVKQAHSYDKIAHQFEAQLKEITRKRKTV